MRICRYLRVYEWPSSESRARVLQHTGERRNYYPWIAPDLLDNDNGFKAHLQIIGEVADQHRDRRFGGSTDRSQSKGGGSFGGRGNVLFIDSDQFRHRARGVGPQRSETR